MEHTKPKRSKLSLFFDKYMIFAGIAGQYLFYAQSYKIFTTKSAEDLSLDGFIVIMIAALSWLVYGIIHKSTPIIAAQIFAIIGMIAVIIGILLYT
jgi:MtN3 and saliva related transmembrane protein